MQDSNQPYDPTAPEGEMSGGSQYISLKDIRILGLVFVLLLAGLFPIYRMGVKNGEKAMCTQNVKAIYEAIGLYAKDHDDGLPPLYRAGDNNLPFLGLDTHLPYTWISDVAGYMGPRASFVCPSSSKEEQTVMEDPKTSTANIMASYGMYAPYGGMKTYNIEYPDQVVLVAETSNLGSATSYDPVKFGEGIPDGFVVGWSDGNDQGTIDSKSVTRLAIRDSADGLFGANAQARHDVGLNALTASGRKVLIKPKDALITLRDKLPGGIWTVPATRKSKK